MTKEEIGQILRNLRNQSNMTQKEVAEIIGRKQQVIGHWETGYSQPDANTLFTLCDLYGASVDESFGFKKSASLEHPPDEQNLLTQYRQLNDEGKEKATEYISDLVTLGRYKKHSVHEMDAKQA